MDEEQTIKIRELTKIKLEADEYLMIRLPDGVKGEQVREFGKVLSLIFGNDAKRVLVYAAPLGFTKLSFEEAQKALEPKPPVLKEDY